MPKLLLFGDSVIKGVIFDGRYHLSTARSFPRLRQQGWEIFSYARMGCCMAQLLRELDKHLPQQAEDCCVLLGCGGNDCGYDWPALAAAPPLPGQSLAHGPFEPQTPPQQFSRLYAQALAQVSASGAQLWAADLAPLQPQHYFDWISRRGGADNLLAWLEEKSLLYRWQEYYAQLVRQAATQAGVAIAELRRPFLMQPLKQLLGEDGVHPTQAGHELIEKTIEDIMLK